MSAGDCSGPSGGRQLKRIYVVAPGGAAAVGGMARFIDYVTREWPREQTGMELNVVDSTGPTYAKAKMPFYFALAVLRVLGAGMLGRIDLLHIHMAEYGSVVRKLFVLHLGRLLRTPVVLHLHGANFREFFEGLPAALRRVVVSSMNRARRVIVLGPYWAEYIERIGVDRERIRIVRNAVPGPAQPPVRQGSGPCRILFLGVLTERKGMPELIEALGSDELRALSWNMQIAGNGDAEPYRALAERLGIDDRLEFLGWVDSPQARALLASSDMFVLPSRHEGLSMAILEAMSFGVPVVATPVGDVREAVEDGVTGRIVPVQDPASLARALAELVRDPELRRRLGDQARARFRDRFDIAVLNRTLAQLFTESMTR